MTYTKTTGRLNEDETQSLFKIRLTFRDKTGPHVANSTKYSTDYARQREMFLKGADKAARACCLAISAGLQNYPEIDQFLNNTQPHYAEQTQILTFYIKEQLFQHVEHFDKRFGYDLQRIAATQGIEAIEYKPVSKDDPKYALFGKKPALTANLNKLNGYTYISEWLILQDDFKSGKILKVELFDNRNYTINNKIQTWISPNATQPKANQPEPIYANQPQRLSTISQY